MTKRILPVLLMSLATWAQDQPQPPQGAQLHPSLSVGICSIRRHRSASITAHSTRPTRVRSVFRIIRSGTSSLDHHLFFAFRPEQNTLFIFDPEIAGGRGFSGVNGSGELLEWRTAARRHRPRPSLTWPGSTSRTISDSAARKETVESDENQLAGERPMNRYTITAGRFTLTDFFDDNRYSHDPRTQFMGWAVMYNGAWDYPADVRGYTWGWVHELHTRTGLSATPAPPCQESPTVSIRPQIICQSRRRVRGRVPLHHEEARRRDPAAEFRESRRRGKLRRCDPRRRN